MFQVANVTLRNHRQSVLVTFLVPRKSRDDERGPPDVKDDTSMMSSREDDCSLLSERSEKAKFVALSARTKTVVNKEQSLNKMKLDLNELNEPNDSLVSCSSKFKNFQTLSCKT